MGIVKAAIGYGIALAVLAILVLYAIRFYRTLSTDYEHKLARRDRERPVEPSDRPHLFVVRPDHAPDRVEPEAG